MSRSYKKPYSYFVKCRGMRLWRSYYNRKFRHAENMKLRKDSEYACHKNPYKHAYADFWLGPTDGRAAYISRRDIDWMYEENAPRRVHFTDHGKKILFRK